MMGRLRRACWAAAAALFLATPAAFAFGGFKAETFKLDNGMEVVVLPDHRVPVVTHMMWYRIGSADEPESKSGIAHFLEHLMFKGTERIAPGEFSKSVARLGGQDNAATSTDYTNYWMRVAKEHLPRVMEMEADRMVNLQLTDEIVLPERDVILEERNQRIDNDPSSQLYEQMMAALYLSHPYGTPIIGWRHEVEGLTREDAVAFYKRYYAPDNAILVIAGDVTAEEVKPLAERYYGGLKPSGVTARVRPKEPPPLVARRMTLDDARVRQPQLTRFYLAPSYATDMKAAHALDVAAQILGGGDTSRLVRALVEEQKLAASAYAYFDSSSYDTTTFSIGGTPREGVPLDELEAAMDKVLAEFLEKGPTAEEMARAKNVLKSDAIYARDSQATMARIYGIALTTGSSVEDVESWPERIEAVTADEVVAAMESVARPEASVTGWLRPKS